MDPDQAAARFAELLERVARGEEFVIARAGRPLAKLVPVEPKAGTDAPARRREGGVWRGRVALAEDFDAPLPPDIARGFGSGTA